MKIKGFNRVELVVAEEDIDRAVDQFNDAFGLSLAKPHEIEGMATKSSTDFDGFIELVSPVNGGGPFGSKLAQHGRGQIGPLVWEVDDIDEAREWCQSRDFRIRHEYDSRKGNAQEQAWAVHQLILDPEQWFGFNVTLMKRYTT